MNYSGTSGLDTDIQICMPNYKKTQMQTIKKIYNLSTGDHSALETAFGTESIMHDSLLGSSFFLFLFLFFSFSVLECTSPSPKGLAYFPNNNLYMFKLFYFILFYFIIFIFIFFQTTIWTCSNDLHTNPIMKTQYNGRRPNRT
jgi:hypothetical protein